MRTVRYGVKVARDNLRDVDAAANHHQFAFTDASADLLARSSAGTQAGSCGNPNLRFWWFGHGGSIHEPSDSAIATVLVTEHAKSRRRKLRVALPSTRDQVCDR
jgi:hypothetical protein